MTPAEIDEALRLGFETLERASAQLASQGWALPMSLTPAETYELLAAGSPEEVDAAFVRLYEAEGGSYFQEVTRDLLNREVLAPWRSLLNQVISAYQRRHFAIAVPALLTVCEGVFMSGRGNETNMRRAVAERVQHEERKWPESFTVVLWHTVQHFINELFRKADFAGARPNVLNRHWILHGRDASTWAQADCLRLIQAVDTVSSLCERRAV